MRLIAIGLFGYAVWRFSEAAFGVVGEGRKVGPRLQSFARGLIYLFFAITAVRVAIGANAGSQAQRQELWTAKAMQHAGGRWIVGLVGVVIIVRPSAGSMDPGHLVVLGAAMCFGISIVLVKSLTLVLEAPA